MTIAVGIDLGMTESGVAVYLNEDIRIIPQENGKRYMPSVVSFTSNGILVGHLAEEQILVNPENTIFGVKRIIGRRFDDPQLQKFLDDVPYNVENVSGNPKIRVNYNGEERLYDPERITSMLLKRLKVKAEIMLGHKIINAVIAVPTYFNDSQRQATKDAGYLAGLNVLQILNESTAGAIAYGHDNNSKDEKYVVIFDFGSGMFDVSVLKIKPGNICETQATLGDTDLGGFDIDSALMEYCAGLFYKKYKIDIKKDKRAVRRLMIACSKAKFILSSEKETVIAIDSLKDGIDFCTSISRLKFEKVCEGILNRTIELLHKVVIDSGVDKKDIDDVVLIGGSSVIPKIRKLVADYFDGLIITKSCNPSLAVVYGAAARAAFLAGYKDMRIKGMLCVDVTALSIGIETLDGIMTIVIEKGTPIPMKATYTITTHIDNQLGVAIRVFEGEKALTCNNHFLGTLELLGLPPLPKGIPRIEITFEIDSNGILTVSAEERSGMKFNAMTINLHKGRLSTEEIDHMLKEDDIFEEENKIESERIRYRDSLRNYLVTISDTAVTDPMKKLNSRDKLEINKICNEIREWIETHPFADVNVIIEKRKQAEKLLQPYANCLDQSVVSGGNTASTSSTGKSLYMEKYWS